MRFSCAAHGADPSAWAHNFDPHSRDGGSELRQDFAGIAVALRGRLARPTGTVLQEVAGKPLTIYHPVYMPDQHVVGLNVDPDAPAPDRVGGAVEARIADQLWRHVEDDLMTAVRDVGGWVAAALGGPGRDLLSDDDPFEPLPGKVSFSWHAYHSALLQSEPEASA